MDENEIESVFDYTISNGEENEVIEDGPYSNYWFSRSWTMIIKFQVNIVQ